MEISPTQFARHPRLEGFPLSMQIRGEQHSRPVEAQTGHPVGGLGEGGLILTHDPSLGFPFHTQNAALLHTLFALTSPQLTVGDTVGAFVGGDVGALDGGAVGEGDGGGVVGEGVLPHVPNIFVSE